MCARACARVCVFDTVTLQQEGSRCCCVVRQQTSRILGAVKIAAVTQTAACRVRPAAPSGVLQNTRRRMCALVLRSASVSFHCVSCPPLPVGFMCLLFPPITPDSVSRTDLLFCSVNGPQHFLFQCWTPALCPVCVCLSDVHVHVELLHILDYFGPAVCLLQQVDCWSAAQNHH